MSTKGLSASELLDYGLENKPIPWVRALATYADPSNWVQVYGAKDASGGYKPRACEWAFIGPMRPGFELAQVALTDARQQRPIIVCLCGSTRFSEAFQAANLSETLDGKIVLSIGCNMRSDVEIFGHLPQSELDEIKTRLDELHKRKIDLADEVLVLNVGGYIGESTRSEIQYAAARGKPVLYLEEKI